MEDIASIKATIASVKKLTDSVAKVLEDGKVGLKDIGEVPTLIMEMNSLLEAVKGVGAEAKDLDAAEVKELLGSVIELVLYVAAKFGIGK